MTLETITDNLRGGYKQLQAGTMRHADELMNERRTNEELRQNWFYTADGEIYSLQGRKKTPTLAITRESDNLVLRHIDDASDQLTRNNNYRPNSEEAQSAIRAKDTVVIDLTKLTLQGTDSEWRYLAVSTTNYNSLNREEKRLAQRVFGKGKDFTAAMQMLADAGIPETRIYVLNPDYVQQEAQEVPIGRASWLNFFSSSSSFFALDRNVYYHSRLRGVRRASVSEQDALQAHAPNLDQVLGVVLPRIGQNYQSEITTELRKLYKL